MADDTPTPDFPADADPLALLGFLQRLMAAMQRGEDPAALMAEAPPGFQEIFLEAQRRAESGDLPDLDVLGGLGFGGLGFPLEGMDDEEETDDGTSPPA